MLYYEGQFVYRLVFDGSVTVSSTEDDVQCQGQGRLISFHTRDSVDGRRWTTGWTRRGQQIFRLRSVQTGSGAHPTVSCLMGNGDAQSDRKAAGA